MPEITPFPPAPNADDLLTDPEKFKRELSAFLAALAQFPEQLSIVAASVYPAASSGTAKED